MPIVLYIKGWRLFFYSNERNEPIHIHGQKGEKECKYWLNVDDYSITPAFNYNMNNKDIREVKKIILQNFDDIVEAWNIYFRGN